MGWVLVMTDIIWVVEPGLVGMKGGGDESDALRGRVEVQG